MGLLFFNCKKTALYTLLLLAVFALSFLGFLFPIFNYVSFWAILIIALFLTFKKIEYGVFIVLLELFIGSKGYLFSFPVESYVVSLRLALFLIVILRYLYLVLKERKVVFFQTKLWLSFFLFVLFLIFGLISGFVNNEAKVVFFDINAFFYFALIFPVFHVLFKKENIYKIIKILSLSAVTISIFTLFIFFDFSIFHYSPALVEATKIESKQLEELEALSTIPENARLGQTTKIAKEKLSLNWGEQTDEKPIIYRWLKDTGLAEVSYIQGRFFRIFMSSQFYVIIYLIILFVYLLHKKYETFKKSIPLILLISLFLIVSFISFSRSFWLGMVVIFFFLLIGLPKKKIFKTIAALILIMAVLFGLVSVVSPDIGEALQSRITSLFQPSTELAASSRMSLMTPILEKIKEKPILGSGFGTLITYKSLIPGSDQAEFVKVYQYEWAYLDIIVKIGIVGLLAYLYFILNIIKEGFRNLKKAESEDKLIIRAILGGLIFLLTVHLTTPFLNHPLGIGLVVICAAVFFQYNYLYSDETNKSIN